MSQNYSRTVSLSRNVYRFWDTELFREICGIHDRNLVLLEKKFSLSIIPRGNTLILQGNDSDVEACRHFLLSLEEKLSNSHVPKNGQPQVSGVDIVNIIENGLDAEVNDDLAETPLLAKEGSAFGSIPLENDSNKNSDQTTSHEKLHKEDFGPASDGSLRFNFKNQVEPKSRNQARYLHSLKENIISIAVGPAGTGKTFLAVTYALYALMSNRVERIILTRPAVEAGENLGFLPGDLVQKVNPYLRPLYDSLIELIGLPQLRQYIADGIIEVAPLAFMRGRTLARSFIILDEAQNVTAAQMKMFLTRLGEQSQVAISGDITQVDLGRDQKSGLSHAIHILRDVAEIGIVHMNKEDITRHPLLEKIIEAYDRNEREEQKGISERKS